MRGRAAVAGFVWLVAIAAIVICVVLGVHDLAHAYVVAWLTLMSLPLGALPILMLLDLTPAADTEIARSLRVLLASLPILALLIIPVLLHPGAIYDWAPGSSLPHQPGSGTAGFATRWFAPGFFAARSVGYLVIWCGLGLVFARGAPQSSMRRSLAAFGLLLHLFVGTLAAFDWFMALDDAFVSSAYGLIVILAQAAFAGTAALLAETFVVRDIRVERVALLTLLALVALATYTQMEQYLVVWSANLPKEIVWYQTRGRDALGLLFTYGGMALLVFAFVILLPKRFGPRPFSMALVALLVVEIFDFLCLASPRATFTIPRLLVDLPFLVALAGLAALCAYVLVGRHGRMVRHG